MSRNPIETGTTAAEPASPQWPTPEQAYLKAPGIVSESKWIAEVAAVWEDDLDREWYLRHAALLDRLALRIALLDNQPGAGRAALEAEATAIVLQDLDGSGVICDPRYYVRQQYALWRASTCADLFDDSPCLKHS
ncbi:hypothetical protein OG727_21340 [Streptomyces caniferus]|uniref:Uncharacterized protein n=1 Tax=Streptomyces caniferus TaxID=285557 RepID=A0ABZ1VRY0_9ACTN|nr:hypothetical protein [Streptomyces caniferus]